MNNWNKSWQAVALILSALALVQCNFNIDPLIRKSNIYYQRPMALGPPSEEILENVFELANHKNDSEIKVIIHGFTASHTHVSIRPLTNAYMAMNVAHICVVDWSEAAALDYHTSRKAVAKVATFLGKLLADFLTRLKIARGNVHVIGHSLGAHIAGGIGRYFNGSLGRVTGLDPALPLFTPFSIDSLLRSDAQFVDVIHTDYPVFGDITPRGNADFYPNFGHTPQRGCEDIDIVTASKLIFQAYSCSHNRAVLLYAESIVAPKNFPALPCSLISIKRRSISNCLRSSMFKTLRSAEDSNNFVGNEASDVHIYMGEYVARNAAGAFYLETYDTPPYGMGLYTKF